MVERNEDGSAAPDTGPGGISTEDLSTVDEQLKRRIAQRPVSKKVTTVENFEGTEEEDPLPTEDAMSDQEVDAIHKIRNMEIQDIVEKIGEEPYDGWKVIVMRKGPPVYSGNNIHFMKIYESRVPQTWDELEELVEARHGGGSYLVRVMDRRAKPRKSSTITFEGEPKLTEPECPSMFLQQDQQGQGANGQDPMVPDRVKALREEITVAQLQKQLDELKGPQGNNGQDNDRISALESKFDQLLEAMNGKQEKPQIPWEIIVPSLATMMTAVFSGNQNNQLQAAKASADSQRFMFDMMMKINQPQKQTDWIEMMKLFVPIMQSMNNQQSDMMKALIPHILDNLSPGQQSEWIQVIDMLRSFGTKAFDIWNTAAKIRHLTEIKEQKQRQLPPSRGGAPTPAADTAPHELPDEDPDLNAVTNQYLRGDDRRKFQLVFYHLLRDAEAALPPEEANFTNLVILEQTPYFVFDWFYQLRNVEDFKAKIRTFDDKDVYTIFDEKIFQDNNRYLWLTRCIRFIKNYYFEQYKLLETLPQKIRCVLQHVVRESEGMRGPEETLFCSLVLSDGSPIELTAFVIASENADGLRNNLASLLEVQDRAALDQNLFQSAEKCEWINDCIEYVTSMFNEEDFDTTEGDATDTTPSDIVDPEDEPSDDEGVSPFDGEEAVQPTPPVEDPIVKPASPKKARKKPAAKKSTAPRKKASPRKKSTPSKKTAQKKKAAKRKPRPKKKSGSESK